MTEREVYIYVGEDFSPLDKTLAILFEPTPSEPNPHPRNRVSREAPRQWSVQSSSFLHVAARPGKINPPEVEERSTFSPFLHPIPFAAAATLRDL